MYLSNVGIGWLKKKYILESKNSGTKRTNKSADQLCRAALGNSRLSLLRDFLQLHEDPAKLIERIKADTGCQHKGVHNWDRVDKFDVMRRKDVQDVVETEMKKKNKKNKKNKKKKN